MRDPNVFAQRLIKTRIQQNLQAKDLAEQIGVTKSLISKYETTAATPSLATIIAIADRLGVSIDYLVGRTDDPRIDSRDGG